MSSAPAARRRGGLGEIAAMSVAEMTEAAVAATGPTDEPIATQEPGAHDRESVALDLPVERTTEPVHRPEVAVPAVPGVVGAQPADEGRIRAPRALGRSGAGLAVAARLPDGSVPKPELAPEVPAAPESIDSATAAAVESEGEAIAPAVKGAPEGETVVPGEPMRAPAEPPGVAPPPIPAGGGVPSGAAGPRGEVGAGGGTPAVAIDTGSSEGMLGSLAAAPPSAMGQAMTQVLAAVPAVQSKEKSDLEASFPEVPRPTGLPRRSERRKAEQTQLENGKAAQGPVIAGGPGSLPETTHPEGVGPLPAESVSTEGPSSLAAEEGGSWWSRFFDRIRRFLSSLPSSDSGVSTSAGRRPNVDTTGDADPRQNQAQQDRSVAEVTERRRRADGAVVQDFGENDVYPEAPEETLRPGYKPSAPPAAPGRPGKTAAALSQEDRMAFDATASPWLAPQVDEGRRELAKEQQQCRQTSEEARAEGRRRIDDETALTRAEQEGVQSQARVEVDAERRRWRDENRRIQDDYGNKSAAKRKEADRKIDDEVKSGEKKADEELTRAEEKARAEKVKAEDQAAEEKRKAKKKPKGWWGRFKDAVASVFDAIKKAVNAIFNALRKLVKGIIEAAKKIVRGIIELARRVIVGLIKAFGEVLKALVTVALAAFPGAAAKARAWIDGKVNSAVKAVNAAAERLKKATDAILDFVGKVLDTALAVVQKIYNAILDVLKFLVLGLMEIMECIGHLVSAARQMPDHFWGQAQEEVIGMNLSEPLPFERAAPPAAQAGADETTQPGPGGLAELGVVNKPILGEEDIAVDEVAALAEPPAYLRSLQLQDGEELEFAQSDDPERTVAAIKSEISGPAPAVQGTGPTEVTSEGGAGALAQPKTPEDELEELMAQAPTGGCTKEKQGEPAKGGEIPEAMKKGPFTPGQRGRYLWHQIKQGVSQWFECNWPWLLAAAVGALLGFILLNILTGGAVLAALPLIMQIVGAIMIGVAIARVTAYVGDYLSQGWQGNIAAAAKALARGLAIGAIELIFALLFNLGAVIKALKSGIKGAAKAAASAAKATVVTTLKNVRQLGRLGAQAGKALLKNGKIMLRGIKSGVVSGAKSLDDLARRLWNAVRFRKFKVRRSGRWLQILGYINPWVVIVNAEVREVPKGTAGSKLTAEEIKALKEAAEPKSGALKKLEVAEYKVTKTSGSGSRGNAGDRLTGDHIPSRAALQAAEEARLGRKLSPAEASRLNNEGVTVVLEGATHAKLSRTYAGRNTAAQIAEDALDLGQAFRKDAEAILNGLKAEGKLTNKVVGAYLEAYRRNVMKGIFSYSSEIDSMFMAFLSLS